MMKSAFVYILATIFAAISAPLYAGDLASEMELKAGLIKRVLDADGISAVSMTAIDAPPLLTGVNRIGDELETQLKKLDVDLVSRAKVSIKIEVAFVNHRISGSPNGLKFTISLVDRLGDTLVDFLGDANLKDLKRRNGKLGFTEDGKTIAKIDNPSDVQVIASVPLSVSDLNPELETAPETPEGKTAKAHLLREIFQAERDPGKNTFIEDNRVSSSADRRFEIELLKTTSTADDPPEASYKVVPIKRDKDGMAFAELIEGDNIAIRIRNRSEERVAVDARLDGISSFHFFQSKKVLPYYAIQKGHSHLLRGFLKSLSSSNKAKYTHFKVVEFDDTVWNQAKRAGLEPDKKLYGSIAVHFHREFTEAKSRGSGGEKGPGIGEGNGFDEQVKTTPMFVGVAIETIVIRYAKP